MAQLTDHGKIQTDRLAMHVGLVVTLLQGGTPLSLLQVQCQHLRTMLKEIIDLEDEPSNAYVQISQLLPDEVAAALAEGLVDIPDDLSSIDDSIDPESGT